jgi:hypothetical protein
MPVIIQLRATANAKRYEHRSGRFVLERKSKERLFFKPSSESRQEERLLRVKE